MTQMTYQQRRLYNYVRRMMKEGGNPSNTQIGEYMGFSAVRASQMICELVEKGLVNVHGHGPGRRFLPIEEPVEPLRVHNWTCSRCGTRNCPDHTASYLMTTEPRPYGAARLA